MNKILLVGCGHMGSALLNSWHKNKSYNISVIDPKNYKNLKKKYYNNVSIYKAFKEIKIIHEFNTIVFAIKPQVAKEVISQFNYLSSKKILFVSIVAGKKIDFINKYLNCSHQIIRAMPNMPALVLKGMTCLISNNMTTEKNKKIVESLFQCVGKTIWLKKESDIDKVTAISGSGPAYYFLFIEHLISESIKLGLKPKVAKELIYQTALGSIDLLTNNTKSAHELRKNIAVKGGTTEAAINVFEKNSKFRKIIGQSIRAAYNRSRKLGNN